ncbi:MAG: YebC/PmpR family DNA-binding transcriptional regulator, partial [Lachnospiraceae bacterium]|nr:YebC/PmpR family DNA-binding transcriptional regulator [Lachnospiraceae bacterium]
YEGYGPAGTAIIVEALTDNQNRTAANVRAAFSKGGGNVGTPGCVSFMFDRRGQILIDKEECKLSADDLMMLSLDAGAEDFQEAEDSYEVLSSPEAFQDVVKALEENKVATVSAEITMIPQNYVKVKEESDRIQLQRILDILDEDDDVQNVYHNWDDEE